MRFGRFELNPDERVLRIDGAPAPIGARAFDLLLALAERRDRLVTKQELLDLVWPGVVVEENNVATQISTLRKWLGAGVIATVPGRGYRFTATPDAPAVDDQVAPAAPPRHNLPDPRTRFIGRDAALADLARLVPQSRLITLTGIGGSGKTRLALEVARRCAGDFADGAWFVDLAPLRDSARVAGACAAALGLDAAGEDTLAARLAAHLGERQALLVLDNCEHVRPGAAALVDALLARAGSSRIVATSREPLAVAGEQLYPVRALSLPATSEPADVFAADAVRVFVDRARLVAPDFELGPDDAAALGDICRRLDGIALAIELAAARVTMLSVQDIAARLSDRFRLLTGGNSAAVRQRTLLATMQWSYDQLTLSEQRMLRVVSTFAGGWTLEAAGAVAQSADTYETLALLTALHDKSLLVVERGAGGQPRYGMLETVREFAQRELDAAGEGPATRTLHAQHFLALAESTEPHLTGPQHAPWMARLRAEQENLVAAIRWFAGDGAAPVAALRLVAATLRYWMFYELDLGCRLTEAALRSDAEAADGAARFEALYGLAALQMHRGEAAASLASAQQSLAIAQRTGSLPWQARALSAIGSAFSTAGDRATALRHDEQALALAVACGDVEHQARVANNIGEIERAHGRFESAERHYRQALDVHRASGNGLAAAIVLHNLVRVLVAMRRHADARTVAVESERLLRGSGEDVLKFELLKVSAALAESLGEPALAARWWGAAQPRFAAAGYRDTDDDEAQMAQVLGRSREALGAAAYDAAEAAGRALDIAAAMDELRQWLSPAR